MRGEKASVIIADFGALGSPPLARGKGAPSARVIALGGITPACAGKSSKALGASFSTPDHPRLRGEKILFGIKAFMVAGSPPLARGKESISASYRGAYRITPACAGKSILLNSYYNGVRDHPRLRGEKFAKSFRQ